MIEDGAKRIFLEASELPEAERASYLARACQGDEGLLKDVQGLLASDSKAGKDPRLGSDSWRPVESILDRVALKDLSPGSQVDDYTLGDELGEGGFGVVFLATQHRPVERKVALKVLKLGMDSRAILARFESERRILARMEHQNIARILDAGTTSGGRPYFVMEYFKGEAITSFVRSRQLSVRQRLELFLQACQAVQHAHNRGVIHRDLKPTNVLVGVVDGAPAVKVIDFGVAKAIDRPILEGSMVTTAGGVIGTPAYMSPEQASGDADIDIRCDVYMLGALLYELLCGKAPFSARGIALPVLLTQIREVDPETPRSVLRMEGLDPRSVPLDLNSIAMRCLEKDRARRYPSALDLASDVQRFLQGRPVEAVPPSTLYKWRKLARRHRVAFVSALLVVLSSIGGVLGLTVGYFEASDARVAMESAYEDAKDEAQRAQLAELEARDQRQVSEDVLRFLTDDVIKSILPSTEPGHGRDVTLREVLDEAARKLNSEYSENESAGMSPAFVGKINGALGMAYEGLGDLTPAIAHTERALELIEMAYGRDHEDTLVMVSRLAEFYRQAERYSDADELFERLVEHPDVLFESNAPHALATLRRFAMLRFGQGQHEVALELIEGVLAKAEGNFGKESNEYLTAATSAAIVRDRIGNSAGAGALFEEIYELRAKIEGRESPAVMIDGVNLAGFLVTRKRYLEASELLEDLMVEVREVYGVHETTVAALSNLGIALSELDRHEEAEVALIEAIEMNAELLGPDHAETLRCETRYADLLVAMGETADAVEWLTSILDRAGERFGPDAPQTLHFRAKWLEARLVAGASSELSGELQALAQAQAQVLGVDDPATLLTQLQLAKNHERLGELEEAEGLYRSCLKRALERDGEDSIEAFETRSDLSSLLVLMGRHREALDLAEEAMEGGRRLLDEKSVTLVLFDLRLARALSHARPRQAMERYQEIHDTHAGSGGSARTYAYRAACALAELHEQAGDEELAAQWKDRAARLD